jgi:shikimate dehydrogenase
MRAIDGKTQIAAVIGDPVQHSLSPAMHNAALETLGLNWAYIACHVLPADVPAAVAAVRALNWRGINVTVPHKQAVIAEVDELSDAARAVGAVNTIINRDGRLIGDNTDVVGIIRAVTDGAGLDPVPERVVVLGAGGAARAIVYAMTTIETVRRVTVLNRTESRAVSLAKEFDGSGDTEVRGLPLNRESAVSALADSGLLINATNAGRGALAGDSAIHGSWGCLHESLVCVDTNYSPPRTLLMDLVEAAGGKAYNGLDMLVYQGARSLELWCGHAPPVGVMRDAVIKAVDET